MSERKVQPLKEMIAISVAFLAGSLTLARCEAIEHARDNDSHEIHLLAPDKCIGDPTLVIPAPPAPDEIFDNNNYLEVNSIRYAQIEQEFYETEDREEIEATAERWFDEFGITVFVGELPQAATDSGSTHDPEKITDDLLRTSIRNAFRDVTTEIPDPFLKALGKRSFEVYYSHSLRNPDGDPQSAYMYYDSGNPESPIQLVIGVDAEIDSGDAFLWGVISALSDFGCRDDHPSFTSWNPEGFVYGKDTIASTDYSAFVNHTATLSAANDVYETNKAALLGWRLNDECNPPRYPNGKVQEHYDTDSLSSRRCGKWELVMRRLAQIDEASMKEIALR